MILRKPNFIIKKLFPPFEWLPGYSTEFFICDLIAGITVGLTLIPQSIAYAALAGLGPEYGLYSSLCGGIIYSLFGTIPQLNVAPTALLSLLTFTFTHNAPFGAANAAILLCFISGLIELSCGILHLGFLIDLVSVPVVAGFTSAGAITIASAQVKNLMGLKFNAEGFTEIWENVFKHFSEIKLWDSILSIICCVFLLILRQVKDYGVPPSSGNNDEKIIKKSSEVIWRKIVWFFSVSRNAIIVISCAVIAYILSVRGYHPFSLTSKVPQGLPKILPPKFTITKNNETYSFIEMAHHLESGIFVVPFIAILSNVAIAKAFGQGKVVNATQEMLAVGFCNLVGSFLSSMPINASFSRAAVSNASGTKTPLAGIYTSLMVILALTFLTPYFSFIPKATLASVIICAVIFMVEISIIRPLWNINKVDLIPLTITLISCLAIGIEVGIIIGIIVDVCLILYYTSRPKIKIEKITKDSAIEYIDVVPYSAILFSAVEKIREKIIKASNEKNNNIRFVVLDCSHVNRVDYTSAKGIASLSNDLKMINKKLVIIQAQENVYKILFEACSKNSIFLKLKEDLMPTLHTI